MRISLFTRLLDFIAPRFCEMCGKRLSVNEEYVCGVCHLHIPRTFFHKNPSDNIMCKMFWGQMPIERATALMYFLPHSNTSRIVYSLKYNNKPDIGIVMGRIMATEVLQSSFFEGIDIIIPVPLAKERQRQRGYNQSEMLAKGISEVTGISIDTTSVRRMRFKESQTRLTRHDRMNNVENMFVLSDSAQTLAGKHVLLVDDVTTTGATIISCANAMKDIPGIKFSVMTLGFTHS